MSHIKDYDYILNQLKNINFEIINYKSSERVQIKDLSSGIIHNTCLKHIRKGFIPCMNSAENKLEFFLYKVK